MAKKNILIKKRNGTTWDELYPITTANNVKTSDGSSVEAHLADNTKHITSAERTAWNAKQNALGYTPVNKAGDTMTGIITAQSNTSYTVAQVRNIIFWDGTGTKPNVQNGAVLLTYTP